MFEIYDNMGRTVDRYLILVNNPDYGDGHEHGRYYDLTTDAKDIFMPGSEDWTEKQAGLIRHDPKWRRMSWRQLPAEIVGKLLDQLEAEVQ